VFRSSEKIRPRILAVASGGGHFVQLRRLVPAFEEGSVVYVTTHRGYSREVAPARLYTVIDGNRQKKGKLLCMLFQIAWIMIRERPDVVITTGAAPGYFAIRLARLVRARTMWIDSIANVEELSLSGRLVLRHADRVITQWEHLAVDDRPEFRGAVL
jgi:UDP-N-acetylglucosamine:LPS N-acetylglucosamine transferase